MILGILALIVLVIGIIGNRKSEKSEFASVLFFIAIAVSVGFFTALATTYINNTINFFIFKSTFQSFF